MTYTTPELLLVGAAQNLVQDLSDNPNCVYSRPDVTTLSDIAELW